MPNWNIKHLRTVLLASPGLWASEMRTWPTLWAKFRLKSVEESGNNPVEEMLSSVERLDDDDGKVTIHDVAQRIGHRDYGSFLVIPVFVPYYRHAH